VVGIGSGANKAYVYYGCTPSSSSICNDNNSSRKRWVSMCLKKLWPEYEAKGREGKGRVG